MLGRVKRVYAHEGVFILIKKSLFLIIRVLKNNLIDLYFMVSFNGKFTFRGRPYKYFRHTYNTTYKNERAVEIPIALDFLDRKKSILEVGNVLANYGMRFGDVLDKYDNSRNVINADVLDFKPANKYQQIISVSTMEHVGWDEVIRDESKIPNSLRNLRDNCLELGGEMLVTLPIGYNHFFDAYLEALNSNKSSKLENIFSEMYFMKRVSSQNDWIQVDYPEIRGIGFGIPFENANGLFVGLIRN